MNSQNQRRSRHRIGRSLVWAALAGVGATAILGYLLWRDDHRKAPASTSPQTTAVANPASDPSEPLTNEPESIRSVSDILGPGAADLGESETDPSSLAAYRRRMQELAPLTGGDPESHLWLAKDLLRKGDPAAGSADASNKLTREDLDTIQRHLVHATRQRPDLTEAFALRAGLLATLEKTAKAIEVLEGAVEENPRLLLVLGSLYRKTGDENSAQKKAQSASEFFRAEAESEGPSRQDARLHWASAELFLDNHDAALAILEDGRRDSPDPRFDALLATLYYSRCRKALSAQPRDFTAALDSLDAGLKISPSDFNLLNELSKLGDRPECHDRVRGILEELISSGKATAAAYLALGSQASNDGDLERAIPLIEKSLELAPGSPTAKNNLAVCLLEQDPSQSARCLELVEAAIRDSTVAGGTPNPAFLETRGRVYLQMGRWAEAVADLERCLNHMPADVRREIHVGLALAYQNLGNEGLANRHRQLATP